METLRKLFSERKYIGSGEDAVLPMDMEAPAQEQHEDEECLENIE